MHRIYELKEKAIKELAKYGEKDQLTIDDFQCADMLAHLAKNLCKVIEAYEEEEEEYSEAYGGGGSYGGRVNFRGNTSMAGGRGGSMAGGSMARGGSYARGRGRGARRDSMGRYSSEGDIRQDIEAAMQEAPNEMVRQKLMEALNAMNSMGGSMAGGGSNY